MTKKEFEILESWALVTGKDLSNSEDRTLLYGYTFNRETYHVYLKDGEIHAIVYEGFHLVKEMNVKDNFDYGSCKRLYPAKCDYEFCQLLRERQVSLPFSFWEEPVDEPLPYYGSILEDFQH